jgi:hypothetical protein
MVHHFQPLIVGNRYIWPCVTMQSELSMLVPIHSASFKGPVEKKKNVWLTCLMQEARRT